MTRGQKGQTLLWKITVYDSRVRGVRGGFAAVEIRCGIWYNICTGINSDSPPLTSRMK